MDQDYTLKNPEFERWRTVAAESGMSLSEIDAVAQVRFRLLAAVWLCQESLPGAAPAEVVRIFEAIGRASEYLWPQGARTLQNSWC